MLILNFAVAAFADEERIIAYHLPDLEEFVESSRFMHERFAGEGEFVRPKEIAKPPFESRFFTKPGRMWNLTKMLEVTPRSSFEGGELVYHEPSSRLVMKGTWSEHCAIDQVFRRCFDEIAVVQVRVFEAEGVQFEEVFKLPENAKEVAGMKTRFSKSGEVLRAKNGIYTLEMKTSFDHQESWKSSAECEFSLEWRRGENMRSVQSVCFVQPGVTKLMVLEAIGLEKTLFAELEVEFFLKSGEPLDSWALDEDGGAFLRDQNFGQINPLPRPPKGFQVFRMMHPIEEFEYTGLPWWPDPDSLNSRGIAAFKESPGFENGEWRALLDLRPFLLGNGLSLSDETFCFYQASRAAYFTNAEGNHLAQIRRCFERWSESLYRRARISVSEVLSKQQVTPASLRAGEPVLLRKIVGEGWPGKMIPFSRDQDFVGEFGFTSDGEIVEVALAVAENKGEVEGGVSRLNVVAQNGVPVIFRQEKVDGRWKALVLQAHQLNWLGEQLK